jgi:hypothetical protein
MLFLTIGSIIKKTLFLRGILFISLLTDIYKD